MPAKTIKKSTRGSRNDDGRCRSFSPATTPPMTPPSGRRSSPPDRREARDQSSPPLDGRGGRRSPPPRDGSDGAVPGPRPLPAPARGGRRAAHAAGSHPARRRSPRGAPPAAAAGGPRRWRPPPPPHDAPMTRRDLYFSLDCEMVGVGPGGAESAVARVAIINWDDDVVLDEYVRPDRPVTDYRTRLSGVTAWDVESGGAVSLAECRARVRSLLRGKILIGHGLKNDLAALGLSHPWCDTRDTATYPPYMRRCTVAGGERGEGPPSPPAGRPRGPAATPPSSAVSALRPRKLRDLAWEELGLCIQDTTHGMPHCPREDAAAALGLYKAARMEWEGMMRGLVNEAARAREARRETRVGTADEVRGKARAVPVLAMPLSQQQRQRELGPPRKIGRYQCRLPVGTGAPRSRGFVVPASPLPPPPSPPPSGPRNPNAYGLVPLAPLAHSFGVTPSYPPSPPSRQYYDARWSPAWDTGTFDYGAGAPSPGSRYRPAGVFPLAALQMQG